MGNHSSRLTSRPLLYVEQQITVCCNALKSVYTRQRFMRRFLRPQNEVVGRLYDSTGNIQVLAGPFQGMRFTAWLSSCQVFVAIMHQFFTAGVAATGRPRRTRNHCSRGRRWV
jgi:hypothetical protein